MELLLCLEAVTSTNDLKRLRRLFDTIESNVRGLTELGEAASAYGGLMSYILMGRFLSERRLIVSRELREDKWNLKTMSREKWKLGSSRLEPYLLRRGRIRQQTPLHCHLINALTPITYAYCGQPHHSNACQTMSRRNQHCVPVSIVTSARTIDHQHAATCATGDTTHSNL